MAPPSYAARFTIALIAPAAFIWCIGLGGCSRPVEQPSAKHPKATEPVPIEQIALPAIDAKGFAAVVAKHRGSVVLVDYWATWCDPCKKLLPHTVALHRELADRGLAVIAVSLDDAEDEAAARQFLAAQGATFENLRAESGTSQRSFVEFDIANGTLPFMRLYDRAGSLHKEFYAPIDPDEVQRAVKELLADSK